MKVFAFLGFLLLVNTAITQGSPYRTRVGSQMPAMWWHLDEMPMMTGTAKDAMMVQDAVYSGVSSEFITEQQCDGFTTTAFVYNSINSETSMPAYNNQLNVATTDDHTWMFLVKPTGDGGSIISSQENWMDEYELAFGMPTSTELRLVVGKQSTGWSVSSTVTVTPGVWYHVAFGWSAGMPFMYVNGTTSVATQPTWGGAMATMNANHRILVGYGAMHGPFAGSIAELAFFRRALTSAEIIAAYTAFVASQGFRLPSCPAGCGLVSGSCAMCPKGKYSKMDGAMNCTSCPKGTFNAMVGSRSCRVCPTGSFSVAGASSCTVCKAGSASPGGATPCAVCAVGTYSNMAGSAECMNCPPGMSSLRNSTTCTNCGLGKARCTGAVACTACLAGTYSDIMNAAACKKCEPGKYSDTVGSSTCIRCAMNKFSLAGAKICTDCPPGTWSMEGSMMCHNAM